MKITKICEIGITGKYQPYRFGTILEEEVKDDKQIEEDSVRLFSLARKLTIQDIIETSEIDEKFKLVMIARDEELEKYKKLLRNLALSRKDE